MTDITTVEVDVTSGTDAAMDTTTFSSWDNETELPSSSQDLLNVSSTSNASSDFNTMQHLYSEHPQATTILQCFIIIEIMMTALELIISIVAAIKMTKWRRNYRNQMLMQLSLARFIKRVIFLFKFFEDQEISPATEVTMVINTLQMYIDFVIVILVLCFIKHMYDSVIIVLVKISSENLYKILMCIWLLPVPITAFWTSIIVSNILEEWYVYLIICCLFRWPIIFLGTSLYITIVYQVLSEKIRQFARSLTIVTFLLCLVTNFYLFSKDVIKLWCLKSFVTVLVSYLSGFLLNFLILCLYVILIALHFNHNAQSSRSFPQYSLANVK
ncbi:hypothetical protein O3G_MSEX011400 [Manduca sexta]|uniref:Transmembrane protein n=1 Tax=Manduca sexta TaxID=7130 RepID=A0A922CV58_MANSE|nr:hypothetical protein O3G_MSEX011400 [Manduca sexta]KAG6459455.1 hypothetical protein O3G_MSEX011400 [Manduca sexta]